MWLKSAKISVISLAHLIVVAEINLSVQHFLCKNHYFYIVALTLAQQYIENGLLLSNSHSSYMNAPRALSILFSYLTYISYTVTCFCCLDTNSNLEQGM